MVFKIKPNGNLGYEFMGKKVTIDDVLEYLKEPPFAEFINKKGVEPKLSTNNR